MKFKKLFYFDSPRFNERLNKLNNFNTKVYLDLQSYINDDYGYLSHLLTKKQSSTNIDRLKYQPFRKKL